MIFLLQNAHMTQRYVAKPFGLDVRIKHTETAGKREKNALSIGQILFHKSASTMNF